MEPSMKLSQYQTQDLSGEGTHRPILCLKTFIKVFSALKFRQIWAGPKSFALKEEK